MNKSSPETFLNTLIDAERLANSQIHLFENILIWKVAKGKKNCNFLKTSSLNWFESSVSVESLLFPLELSENSI